MFSQVSYVILVVAVAALRLMELKTSRRNIAALKAKGGVEKGASLYPWMVAVHTGFLLSCVLEVWLVDRPWIPWLGASMSLVFAAGMTLRHWTIRTLGALWSTRVVYVAADPLVASGPFRWLRHPNYVGVVLEIFSLPLIHTAWLTAVVFSAANAVVVYRRIRIENEVLASRANHNHVGESNFAVRSEE